MSKLRSNPLQIALVTAGEMPKLDPETHLIVEALERRGVRSELIAWDSAVNWADIPLVVIRTTWDYFKRLPEFLAWARHVEAVTRLVNPRAVVEWNCHKRYMRALDRQAVPTVPTLLIEGGAQSSGRHDLANCGWREVVIKPAVSIGAIGALHARAEEHACADHMESLLAAGDVLVQPFISSVSTEGEVSMIYFDGQFSHAIRKLPKTGEYRVQDHHGGTVHVHMPDAEELGVAAAALAASPETTMYARIDLVRLEGKPVVMELELIEPALFLASSPSGTQRFAEILKSALDQRTG